jgi:hypothetical protein
MGTHAREVDFSWVSGDDELSHRRVIGSGGYGEVHEVTSSIESTELTEQMVDNTNNIVLACSFGRAILIVLVGVRKEGDAI